MQEQRGTFWAMAKAAHEVLSQVGERLERAWRADWFNESKLPGLSVDVLTDARLEEHVTGAGLLQELGELVHIHRAYDEFADFAHRVWVGERLYLEVLYWLDGTTSIHEHGFRGAFAVVEGGSVHSRYGFNVEQRVGDELLVGDVVWRESERLRRGAVRAIDGGAPSAHALFHLERPSVTVVVRNVESSDVLPQFRYLPPHVALGSSHATYAAAKRVAAIRTLGELDPAAAMHAASAMLARATPVEAFEMLNARFLDSAVYAAWREQQLEDLTRRYDFGAKLAETIRDSVRLSGFAARRKLLRGNKERTLLALLMNVPERSALLRLVADFFPDRPPDETITELLVEIGDIGIGTDVTGDNAVVLQHMIAQRDWHALIAKMREEYDADSVTEVVDVLRENYETFRTSPLLRPLMRELPPAPSQL